jgi:3-hydroxybutyryl-CoA dehydrogenase
MAEATERILYDRVPCGPAAVTDILIEAGPEDYGIKAAIFKRFNKFCPERALFVTNTSSLRPSKIAKATGRPDRFAAFHFHIPVWDANVVDIMPHARTSPETVHMLSDFAKRIGQIPIVMEKEANGYVFNTMLNGIIRSSLHLAASGTASIEDIDRSWMAIMAMPIGPFGIMDRIGIDLVYRIALRSARLIRFLPKVRRILDFLEQYVKSGRLGLKTGQGFYSYPHPAFEEPKFLAPPD